MSRQLCEMDTRFWEVFDAEGKSLGIFMYGDMIYYYSVCGNGILEQAYTTLKSNGLTSKVVGNIYPLSEDSPIPEIQARKIKERQKEKDRNKRRAKKRGYKLDSKMHFGKRNGETIQSIIEKDRSYFEWLIKENVLLLHPEVKTFYENIKNKS